MTDPINETPGWDGEAVLAQLRVWARELGFSQIEVAGINLIDAEPGLLAWLEAGFHGSMHYMATHGMKRARPAELVPGTLRVLTLRMDYLPRNTPPDWQAIEWQGLQTPAQAQVSLYARGRDYHKVLRQRLQQLADKLGLLVGPLGYRCFTDSAPVLEVELAARGGIAWRGKHTLALHRDFGSMFFLGELFVDLPLPLTPAITAHCGACTACIDICPTQAIVGPYRVDARRCISYLTIESDDPIPVALRPAMGNRIYGCDDCQLVCPWNKFAVNATLPDFDARAELKAPTLLQLWQWDEAAFLAHTEGSAIRRIGYQRWRRNLAVAMGNALRAQAHAELRLALSAARADASALVAEHIDWALAQGSAASEQCADNGTS